MIKTEHVPATFADFKKRAALRWFQENADRPRPREGW